MDYIIDAKNQKLGRIASQIAQVLQEKDSPHYEPRLPGTKKVIVKNVSKLVTTGRKPSQKIYYRHTGYMGHLRKRILKEFFAKSPEKVLRLAVKRMLPQNFLLQKRLNRLIVEK
ncbi:MAG: 50S ribosomal protein L13 [Candidatus Harrisonbacteria bacterium]|nr:50S ribosomal protein L13 [Candidatus Harrisonbacteria bacterium]